MAAPPRPFRLACPPGTLAGLVALATFLALSACGEHAPHEHHPSGAVCIGEGGPTYANFAKDFLERYCADCHASDLPAAQRQGAPRNANLDTLPAARRVGATHLDALAASGPLARNTAMPPHGFSKQPTDEERRLLGEWLACDMP